MQHKARATISTPWRLLAVALLPWIIATPSRSKDWQRTPNAKMTILCCDFSANIPVRTDADAAAALASLVLIAARSKVLLLPSTKTVEMTGTVQGQMPQDLFLQRLKLLLARDRNLEVQLAPEPSYNGFEQKYDATEHIRDTPWALELRVLTEVAQTSGGFMPSVGVFYRLIETNSQRIVTSGTLASVNATRGEPNFFTRPRLTPFLPRIGNHATGKEFKQIPITGDQLRATFDPKSPDDVGFMENSLRLIAEQMAAELTKQLEPYVSSPKIQ
ncbi:MAG: hypothetical protein EAZ30_09910 [Betaproteobacteria bacterium]|nr:MAG: hypothetical protein EAZ43_13185 [Betaproteobacteria bacterium]TAG47294.1 MAG: hypothetical protein EAZ30_09910 [Betaproteobacteria bacterium]